MIFWFVLYCILPNNPAKRFIVPLNGYVHTLFIQNDQIHEAKIKKGENIRKEAEKIENDVHKTICAILYGVKMEKNISHNHI